MKLSKRLTEALPFLAFCLLIVYLSYHVLNGIIKPTEIFMITSGHAEKTAVVTGYIFRNENMITSEYDADPIVDSGERVRVSQAVATAKNDKTIEIKSPCAGYFYSDVDGYEDRFTADAAKSIVFTDFNMLISSGPCNTSNAIGKIASDFDWYFAYTVDSADDYTLGESYLFDFNGIHIKMELLREDIGETGVLLVFKTSAVPSGFDFSRVKSAKVTLCEYDGYIVPSDAIKIIDKCKYIYIFDSGILKRTEIEVLYEYDDSAIISASENIIGMSVAVGGNLYDGKVMK